MTATTISYRKTKQGQWVVFGPASLVHAGQVIVTKRDGSTKSETVESVGRTFSCDGIEARYGYIAERETVYALAPSSRDHAHRYQRGCPTHGMVEWDGCMCDICGHMG